MGLEVVACSQPCMRAAEPLLAMLEIAGRDSARLLRHASNCGEEARMILSDIDVHTPCRIIHNSSSSPSANSAANMASTSNSFTMLSSKNLSPSIALPPHASFRVKNAK